MNTQPPPFAHYRPPTDAQQNSAYHFEYPPPPAGPQVPQAPQQARPYAYAYPQTAEQQPPHYFRNFGNTPSQPLQQQQPSRPNSQVQQRQQQHETNSPQSTPGVGPSASRRQATSPEIDSLETQLLDALNNENNQEQPQQNDDQIPNVGDENEPIYNLPPPPENTYPSEAELESAIHAWSLEHGYELVKRASKKNAKNVSYKRYFHCSKYGAKSSKVPPEQRQRANRKTNRMSCQMSISAVAVDPGNPGGEWQVRHRKSHHTHPAAEGRALAGHRRRARDGPVLKAIDGLFHIGASTSQVMHFLSKTQPKGLFTRTDVGNMRIKYRKDGTCIGAVNDGRGHMKGPACLPCRQKRVGCTRERPGCAVCARRGAQCEYDQEAPEPEDVQMDEDGPSTPQVDQTVASVDDQHQQTATTKPAPKRGRGRPSAVGSAEAQEILAELRVFQQDNVAPPRLELTSSTVEVLAQSSCGTGESYKSLPILASSQEWPAFRDAMVEASMKENTYDVLIGVKGEPQKPITARSDEGKPAEIETWNEYIRQLAIYKRRNTLLLSGLRSRMTPSYRNRVSTHTNAATVWTMLEDLFQPRGCETAFRLYLDLNSITLSNSADLKDYIHRLQSTYDKFKQLKLNTSPPPKNRLASSLPTVREGGEAVPEEMVCFLFLQNLGPEWRRWVEGLCATNNIGGFGTGVRLGLKDLCERAVGYEAMQRRQLGR